MQPFIQARDLYRILNESPGNDNLIIDARWYLPTENKNAEDEYHKTHIPQAQFFNIDKCCDLTSPLPHTMPHEQTFQAAMREIGANRNSQIYVYDQIGCFSAPRVYWMIRYFGHNKVAILDGGLNAWHSEKLPTTHSIATHSTTPKPKGDFIAKAAPDKIAQKQDILEILQNGSEEAIVVDARPEERFLGLAPEPRPGLRAGHIPNAVNIPYSLFTDKNSGKFKSTQQIQNIINHKITDNKNTTIICSCGSGITACTNALALEMLGYANVKIYDGSWAEWGADNTLPIQSQKPHINQINRK